MSLPTPNRRTVAFVLAAVLLLVGVVVAATLPVPYVRLSPGPTYNTIGSYDGTALITIKDHRTYPTAGNLDMTTVSEAGGPVGRLTLGDALRGWIDQAVEVVPVEQLYPPDANPDQVKKESQVAFTDSQSEAVAAALRHLGIPVTEVVIVTSVEAGAPADGTLKVNDVMLAVAGEVVHTAADVGRLVRSKPVGTPVPMTVRRDGFTTKVTVVTGPKPGAPKTSYLGIATTSTYKGPFPIEFGLEDVGGPSAGTMFALGIVDMLTPGELNGGKYVAGTGTIDAAGTVGPIGGIAQKMEGARRAGATLFLAPKDNCGDVVGHVPDGLTVTPVTTLDDAVGRVEAYVAGKTLPSCPAS